MGRLTKVLPAAFVAGLTFVSSAHGEQLSAQELDSRIQTLEQELAQLKAQKAGVSDNKESATSSDSDGTIDTNADEFIIHDTLGGRLKVGGAIRANYVIGDYDTGSGPGRGGNGGNFELDTFRVNLDYTNGQWTGKAEYRFYNGYNFFHTLQAGYKFADGGVLEVGLTRVPFGIGAYGPANSWFFDQHYYVGLADDMDVGAVYTKSIGDWTLDVAFFARPEWNGNGNTKDSTRYSYDIVDTGAPNAHYTEQGQLNLRAIRKFDGKVATQIGGSLQISRLEGDSIFADDTFGYAAAVHMKNSFGPWTLMTQLTRYDYNPDYTGIDGSNDELIAMGAFDWAAPVASKAWLPSAALSYTWSPERIGWIDSITFYNDFSIILKDGDGMNDSALNVLGMAIAKGGWYIYVDYARSNGNYFVGSRGDFGANSDNKWQDRFNINFGYYF